MRKVLYIDESGRGPKAPCSCYAVGGVPIEVAGSYMYGGLDLVEALKRRYGIVKELKWRVLKRMGVGEEVYAEIVRRYPTYYVAVHIGEEDLEQAFLRLIKSVKADLYVVDEGLVNVGKFACVVAKLSHKVLGIQLADVVAGRAVERLCPIATRGSTPA